LTRSVRKRTRLSALALVLAGPATLQDPEPPSAEPAVTEAVVVPQDVLLDAESGQGYVETPGYRALLEAVATMSDADFDAQPIVRLDYDATMADPDAWRGKHVTVRGILVQLRAHSLERPLRDERDIYRATITEADGTEGVICDMLGPPPDLVLPHGIEQRRDLVDVEGVFYRTVRFENTASRVVEAPYLIIKRIRLFDEREAPRESSNDWFKNAIIVAAVLFMIFRGGLAYQRYRVRNRKPVAAGPGFREQFERRLHHGATVPPAPPPPAPPPESRPPPGAP